MGSQPTYTRAGIRPKYATSLAGPAWSLLVRLPSRVLAAVIAVRAESGWIERSAPDDAERPTVSAALAGIAAIAAARSADPPGCRLTSEVASAIFASDDASDGPDLPRPERIRAECADAGYVLAQRVPSGDAGEYRRWVRRIGIAALAVPELAVPDPYADLATADLVDPIGAAPVRLLDECERALAG
jgi:hypothetical protein